MPTGKGSHFTLDVGDTTTPDVVTVDPFLRGVAASNEAEEVDGTVVTSQKREFEPTYERDRLTLRLKFNATALEFARDAKGKVDAAYVYGPLGNAAGAPLIQGLCNVLRAQTIPPAEPGTLTEIEVELNINTEEHSTFPVIPLADGASASNGGSKRKRAA